MEKVDQDYLDNILFSSTKNDDRETDEKRCVQEDPMEVYEKIQADAVDLGNGDLALDQEIIMKFLQVSSEHFRHYPVIQSISGSREWLICSYCYKCGIIS
jgi:hypothetical protein